MPSLNEDIECIARSEHRIAVLDELSDGPRARDELSDGPRARDELSDGPRARDELCRATGASSPTIGRIFSDFEDRRWIDRDGPTYELTPLDESDGSVLADDYPPF